MKGRVHAHARAHVVSSRWDEKANVGFWTFECQSCVRTWEEKALYGGRGPVRNKPLARAGWALYARYWGKAGGGVKTPCPKCGAGADKPR